MLISSQLIRFLIAGLLSTTINFFLFCLIFVALGFSLLLSSSIGYLGGIFAGYQINKKWTFEITGTLDWFVSYKYLSVYLISLSAGLAMLQWLVNTILISPLLANCIVIIQTTITNFIMIKFFVFKK
jgi:putative flippase GtrA